MAQSATAEVLEPLFGSAHAALVFALNFSSQAYDRPMMNRMAAPSLGTGKGLSGLDGAAQAGMVRAEVKALGELGEAILIARIAPRTEPCSCRAACCSGYRPNKEWTGSISILADYVKDTALDGCSVDLVMRRDYVVRHFTRKDERVSIEDLAKKHEVATNTASAHASKVATLFAGLPVRKERPAVQGLEAMVTEAIEDRLREIGMVGY
jgi:hypothetical protein